MSINNKVSQLVHVLSTNLYEREEAIKLSMLALLAGESIFLLGPPGVAKSLVSRRIKLGIKDASSFEYLMHRFSTPDEIFGPISLKQLDEDKYERKIEGYLPSVEIAFLDEIWKASPSIQNTLLTIINEKIYRNGNTVINVPLLLLIAASNELPAPGEGLDALYDRFVIRVYVDNVANENNLKSILDTKHYQDLIMHPDDQLTIDELKTIRKQIQLINLDDLTFKFITTLRRNLQKTWLDHKPYISDRKWKQIVNIMKANAYVSNRDTISPWDWLLTTYMIWETKDQLETIKDIVLNTWMNLLIERELNLNFDSIDASIEQINAHIQIYQGPVPYQLEGVNHYAYLNDKINEVVFIDASDYDKRSDILRYKHCKTSEWNKDMKHIETFYTSSVYCHFSSDGKEVSFNGDTYRVVENKQVIINDKKACLSLLKQAQADWQAITTVQDDIINFLKQQSSILTIANDYQLDRLKHTLNQTLNKTKQTLDNLHIQIKDAQ